MANLLVAGYLPEQIDELYITHRGQDHIGGLTTGKQRAFSYVVVSKGQTLLVIGDLVLMGAIQHPATSSGVGHEDTR